MKKNNLYKSSSLFVLFIFMWVKMKNNVLSVNGKPVRVFDSAEEVWFWFCLCESVERGRSGGGFWTRPCETSDVAIIVKRLVREGKITQNHLRVLSKYGLEQMPPCEAFGASSTDCFLWKSALFEMEKVFRQKSIVADSWEVAYAG